MFTERVLYKNTLGQDFRKCRNLKKVVKAEKTESRKIKVLFYY